jgi:hypothetical protein
MTTQQFLKGLMMALVAVILAYFTQSPIDYPMMAIAAVSSILVYAGKNLIAVLHSNSPAGSLSLINIASALLLLIGNGVIDGVAMYYIKGVILWGVLGKITISIALTYVITTWFAPPYTPVKTKLFV